MFFTAPTTNVNELQKLAVKNGINVNRNCTYYDSLNLTQMIGSGRITGGVFQETWRRWRKRKESSYNTMKAVTDVKNEVSTVWTAYGHAGVIRAIVGVVGSGFAKRGADGPAAKIGLALALSAAGDAAFQSFFPKQYHNLRIKFLDVLRSF